MNNDISMDFKRNMGVIERKIVIILVSDHEHSGSVFNIETIVWLVTTSSGSYKYGSLSILINLFTDLVHVCHEKWDFLMHCSRYHKRNT